jgi:UDP-galactopyranose mutase
VQYAKYAERAEQEKKVTFVGRLATYRYYNMDQVVAMALTEYEKLKEQ